MKRHVVATPLLAGVAGLGASMLLARVAGVILLHTWLGLGLHTEGPPPHFPQLLLPAMLVGSFVATRLAGLWGAAVLLGLFVATSVIPEVIGAFRFVMQCWFIPAACGSGSYIYTDRVVELVWMVPGALVGIPLGLLYPIRIPLWRGLSAMGVVALINALLFLLFISIPLTPFCSASYPVASCVDAEYAAYFGTHVLAAVGASWLLVRLGGTWRDAVLPATLLLLAALPNALENRRFGVHDGVAAMLAWAAPAVGAAAYVALSLIGIDRARRRKDRL